MLDAATIKGFVGTCLLDRFDDATTIPDFHEELWDMCTSDNEYIAIAAPRGHAKSTSITLSYLLATVLFREHQYVLLVSDTETQAKQFLADIKIELSENDDLKSLFDVGEFVKDTETVVIVSMKDGYQFRIDAKGSEQKVRGMKWRNKRPDLIVCDDLENDEIVMNKERREKFRNWFLQALLPCRSKGGKIVVVGTILHMDSMLERLLNHPNWHTVRYAAHNEDFSSILWPERYTEEDFKLIRDTYVSMGNPAGYSQEYLNYPIDESTAYFRRDDFRYYNKEELDYNRLTFYTAVDFAISQKEKSDFTVILTVGIDAMNKMYVVDVQRGRWDAKEIIDEMFEAQTTWNPAVMVVEEGHIRKALGPFLKEEMLRTGTFINLLEKVPSKDKETRARSIQARIKQGTVYFNGKANWYPDLEQELVRFPKDVHDDQVDAFAWIGSALTEMSPGQTKEEYADDKYNDMFEEELSDRTRQGANKYTGY